MFIAALFILMENWRNLNVQCIGMGKLIVVQTYSKKQEKSHSILKPSVKVTQSCPILWDPMNYTVHGLL